MDQIIENLTNSPLQLALKSNSDHSKMVTFNLKARGMLPIKDEQRTFLTDRLEKELKQIKVHKITRIKK